MDTNDIVLAIDAEISRLQQAKALLTDTSSLTHAKRKPGRPAVQLGAAKQPASIRRNLTPSPESASK